MRSTVIITRRGVERVRQRHLWIYRSDVIDTAGAEPGTIVRVSDRKGALVGQALFSSSSQITLRMISLEDEPIDKDFWKTRLDVAHKLRENVVEDTNAWRLIYGESDGFPSLIIDRFDDSFVIQTLSQASDALKPLWTELLADRYNPRAIIERNEAKVRDLEGLPRIAGLLSGTDPGEVLVDEAGVRFSVNLLHGQKTGAFLDQRENRIASRLYSRGRVLDCFTFEGAFALHLARTAEQVLAVDIAESATEAGRRNAALNEAKNIEFITANVFDILREFEHAGERFDVINLDPPAFAKNRNAVEAAARGYKEINVRALKLLNPGGTLITSTCSYHMPEEGFLNVLASAAADAGRTLQLLEKRTQSRDHPILISMPETYYLKCFILRAL